MRQTGKLRRWTALLLACALAVGLLAACGAQPQTPDGGDTETEGGGSMSVTGLTTDGLTNPLGLESEKPLFGWRMEAENLTGAKQSAYQITVTDPEGALVWDSGKVEDSASQNVEYGGEALKPQTRYVWNLAVTDGNGTELPAQEAYFETSLMNGSADAGKRWRNGNGRRRFCGRDRTDDGWPHKSSGD